MPIGHGPKRLMAIRIASLALDSIIPVCLLFTCYNLFSFIVNNNYHHIFNLNNHKHTDNNYHHEKNDYPGKLDFHSSLSSIILPSWTIPNSLITLLKIYTTLETIFFIYTRSKKRWLQSPQIADGSMSKEEQISIFERIMDEVNCNYEYMDFQARWFAWRHNNVPLNRSDFHVIQRENMIEWLAWAFCCMDRNQGLSTEVLEEIEVMIRQVEKKKLVHFRPGYNKEIKALILNFNPVEADEKPFFLYSGVSCLEFTAVVWLRLLGFQKFSIQNGQKELSYWVRLVNHNKKKNGVPEAVHMESNSTNKLPLVFFHGISGGLFCYTRFFTELVRSNQGKTIFIVELPQVMLKQILSDKVLLYKDHVNAVVAMLNKYSFEKADFAGHSLGSVCCTWMVKHSNVVASLVLIDPICFKLYDPTLIYHFVYRKPRYANEYLIHWFVSRELHISHHISRHFIWHQNIMFPENMPPKSHVIISEHDNLIDTQVVYNYLSKFNVSTSVLFDADHGQFLLSREQEAHVIQKIKDLDIDHHQVLDIIHESSFSSFKSHAEFSNSNIEYQSNLKKRDSALHFTSMDNLYSLS